ncbi:maestro heat-like repeat-containing protein family member 1 [Scyliorhinus canicula]|uniref:maestro heat-like repeat-containing protein family member 1 n=1 Tax=Scyliorhinus canicula TaxID=7830 RepID=UPI0018F47FA3|nr:maestro heat-like repeat-containing protein family member 1 [Scyliorhinus canicula]
MEADCSGLYLGALITAASDTDKAVREQVVESLCISGRLRPALVLRSCHACLSSGTRATDGHRLTLLRGMALIVGEAVERIEQTLAREVTAVTVAELLTPADKAGLPRQEAAGQLLVALGRGFVDDVLEQILEEVKPGVFPHPMVLRTLGNLARSNVESWAPHLPHVLTVLLPVFGLVKDNGHICALTSALGLFSESVLEYLRPSDKAPEPTLVNLESFSRDIYALYKNRLSKWLQEKDGKVRAAILEALGHMVPLLPRDRLEEELPRLLPQLLSLYARPPGGLPVTRCLLSVLGASVGTGSWGLRGQADKLLAALHGQLCAPLAPGDQPGLSHREGVLACFALLAREWPQPVARFVLGQMAGDSDGRQRLPNLTVLARLVDTVPSELRGRKDQMVTAVQAILLDDCVAVKRAALKAISSLTNHGYLGAPEGAALVEYIVGLCAAPGEEGTGRARGTGEASEETPAEELRAMAETLMEELAGAEATDSLVWPALLRFVTPVAYTQALPVLCRSLEKAARRRQESGTLRHHGDAGPGLPSPQALLARLLTVSTAPDPAQGRCPAALRLLLALGPTVRPSVEGLWEKEIPELLRQLEGDPGSGLPQECWDERLLLFLSRSLEAVADEEWSRELADQMLQQGSQLAGCPRERGFLFQCRGLTLKQTGSREAVRAQLQEMLRSAQYRQAPERQGLALGIGLCAARHLDDALSELEDFARSHLTQSGETLANLVKGKPGNEEAEAVRSGILLCYGHVARLAPAAWLQPGFGADILALVLLLYQSGLPASRGRARYPPTLKLSLAEAVTLTARTILDNVPRLSRHCPAKEDLLSCLGEIISGEPRELTDSPLRESAMAACAYLIQLEPASSEDFTFQLLSCCVDSVIGLGPVGSGAVEEESQTQQASACLLGLLKQALLQDLSPTGLRSIFKALEGWVVSGRDYERRRALEQAAELLRLFLGSLSVQTVVNRYNLEEVVGRLVPRCADPSPAVRRLALDCLCVLFYIQLRYEGSPAERREVSVERLRALKEESRGEGEGGSRLQTCWALARVISERMSRYQLRGLLATLCQGLTDAHPACASTAAAVLHAVLGRRGQDLQDEVAELLGGLCPRLGVEPAQPAAMRGLSILAWHHAGAAVSALLAGGPDPCQRAGSLVWGWLGGRPVLGPRVVGRLLDELDGAIQWAEGSGAPRPGSGQRAPRPVEAARALREILSHPESGPAIDSLYPRLLGTLLVLCSCAGKPPQPHGPPGPSTKRASSIEAARPEDFDFRSYAAAMLKELLGRRAGLAGSMEKAGGWQLMADPDTLHDGVALLAEAMASSARPHLPALLDFLSASLNRHTSQRAAVAAFFGEMVRRRVPFDPGHMDILVSGLLRCLLDNSPTTRLLVVKGLGDVAMGDPATIRRYSTKLLAAILTGMEQVDAPHPDVTLEALSGLSKVLAQLGEIHVRDILVNLCLAVRPFFEDRCARVRSSALGLFGALSTFAVGESKAVLLEQVHSTLVGLLLYLNHGSPEVSEASRRVLALVGPFLGSDKLCEAFQAGFQQGPGQGYWDFVSGLTGNVVWDLPDHTQTYLSSSLRFCTNPSPGIRANAIIFTGHLLKNMPKERNPLWEDDGHAHGTITSMIRDPDPRVRMTAAKTLCLFS